VVVAQQQCYQGKPWVVRWSDSIDLVTGKAKWSAKSFKYKLQAQDFAAEKRTESPDISQAAGTPYRMTLGRFLNEWSLTRDNNDYQSGTRTLDGNTVARLTTHFGKHTPLADITPMEAAKFISMLARIDGKDKPLSPWSRARTLRNVKTMFNTAVEWGLIERNPFGRIRQPRLPEARWHYLMPKEFHALLNASNGKYSVSLRCKALYALAYCCGLRLGEILNLQWDQNLVFKTGKKADQIAEATVHVYNQPATATEPPFSVKDKEERRLHVPARCREPLLDLKAYNEMTDQTPYIVLDRRQYQTMTAKWEYRRKNGMAWENRNMQNNTLSTFKRHLRWANITPQTIIVTSYASKDVHHQLGQRDQEP